MTVTKRDGRKVDFNKSNIKLAVLKAFLEIDGEETIHAREKASEIARYVESLNKDMSVEEIQDIIIAKLMQSSRKDVAEQYVKYRYKQELARKDYKDLMDAVSEKLNASDVQNQNANVDEKSFGGRIGEATNLIMKKYALDYCMSDMAKNNHINNMIYQHDLDHYAIGNHNCLSIPFDKLLKNGFNTRQTDVRPAQSVSTAFQLLAVIFQLQSLQQFGGVSATHIDWTMVPYVRKSFYKHYKDGIKYIEGREIDYSFTSYLSIADPEYEACSEKAAKYAYDMTEREIYQAVEGMFHNLNTLQSRSGNQLPFTSINYGTCTLPEGRLITKAILDVLIKGVGKSYKTSVFPCGIFQVMKGVNKEPGTANYDLYRLALRATARRLYPNYANCDWSGNAGYDKDDPRTYFSTINKLWLSIGDLLRKLI